KAFQQETGFETMTAIVKGEVAELPVAERHIPPGLARIVDRCMEKAASARFQTASDLIFALEGVTGQLESGLRPAAERRALLTNAKHVWAVAASALVIGMLTAVTGMSLLRMFGRGEQSHSTTTRLTVALPLGDEIGFPDN